VYEDIILGFEKSYYETLKKEKLVDSPARRIEFLSECVILLRDGPRLQSRTIQYKLVRYFQWELHKEVEKLQKIATAKET